MVDKFNNAIKEWEDKGSRIHRIKVNSKTLNKIPSSQSVDIDEDKYGYKKLVEGIPVFIDENIKDNKFRMELDVTEDFIGYIDYDF